MRFQAGTTSSPITAASAKAVVSQTPKSAIRTSRMTTQIVVLIARRTSGDSASQRACVRPTAPSAFHQYGASRLRTSAAFRCPLAQQALWPEDEDEDEDREHDRLRPVAARRVPAQAFVERLDEADAERAEDGARQVA